jgi:hypothetical protein
MLVRSCVLLSGSALGKAKITSAQSTRASQVVRVPLARAQTQVSLAWALGRRLNGGVVGGPLRLHSFRRRQFDGNTESTGYLGISELPKSSEGKLWPIRWIRLGSRRLILAHSWAPCRIHRSIISGPLIYVHHLSSFSLHFSQLHTSHITHASPISPSKPLKGASVRESSLTTQARAGHGVAFDVDNHRLFETFPRPLF